MPKVYTPKLTPRTEGIVELVPKCRSVADIGCDHGYVSIALVQREVAGKAIACDIKEGPLERAKKNIAKAALEDKIDTRLAPGLAALSENEADVIVISGMGQRTIAEILTDNMETARNAEYLVLQPQSEIPEMREFLKEKGFNILRNRLMKEEEKYYFALLVSAKHSESPQGTDLITARLKSGAISPELEKFSTMLDNLFGLDLIFCDKEMAYYLIRTIDDWSRTIESLNAAKKPDYEKIKMMAERKTQAEVALELNTLLCGIDANYLGFLDGELLRKQSEE